jgi:hypothetical protein
MKKLLKGLFKTPKRYVMSIQDMQDRVSDFGKTNSYGDPIRVSFPREITQDYKQNVHVNLYHLNDSEKALIAEALRTAMQRSPNTCLVDVEEY